MSLRLLSALLLLAALGLHSSPVEAQSSAATRPTPSLEERLDRLAADIDRNPVDLHVPGAALAIVRGDKELSVSSMLQALSFRHVLNSARANPHAYANRAERQEVRGQLLMR